LQRLRDIAWPLFRCEARYTIYVLRKAQFAEPELASQLINDLIRDLSMAKNLSDAGVETLALIRSLALSLYCSTSYVTEWDAAYEAAETWCRSASN
jgi:hypothetical protein